MIHKIIVLLYLLKDPDKAIRYALDQEYSEYLEYCINKNGININEYLVINSSKNLLQYAVSKNKITIAQVLLKLGADPNHHSSDTLPPLVLAIENDNHKMVKMLLDYKADPRIKDYKDKKAFDYSNLDNERITDLLLWSEI